MLWFLPIPDVFPGSARSQQPPLGAGGTDSRGRGHRLWGYPLFSELALRTALGSGTVLPPPRPPGGRRSHHGEIDQSHGGCGPGTAHGFLSVAHGHGHGQARGPRGPLDVGQALAPGSCSHQPEEGEGHGHTEVLEEQRHRKCGHTLGPRFLSSCSDTLGSRSRDSSPSVCPEPQGARMVSDTLTLTTQRRPATGTPLPVPSNQLR